MRPAWIEESGSTLIAFLTALHRAAPGGRQESPATERIAHDNAEGPEFFFKPAFPDNPRKGLVAPPPPFYGSAITREGERLKWPI